MGAQGWIGRHRCGALDQFGRLPVARHGQHQPARTEQGQKPASANADRPLNEPAAFLVAAQDHQQLRQVQHGDVVVGRHGQGVLEAGLRLVPPLQQGELATLGGKEFRIVGEGGQRLVRRGQGDQGSGLVVGGQDGAPGFTPGPVLNRRLRHRLRRSRQRSATLIARRGPVEGMRPPIRSCEGSAAGRARRRLQGRVGPID